MSFAFFFLLLKIILFMNSSFDRRTISTFIVQCATKNYVTSFLELCTKTKTESVTIDNIN